MSYVDGFVIPVPKGKVAEYRKMAAMGKKMWMKYGALQYFECVGDDLQSSMALSFSKVIKPKPGETVVFSWIVFKSRSHRDKVNAKVIKDPRICGMDPKTMPFDCKRMLYGGFKTIVDL
jgi:uncharacterized protein YbaA (DUF1428 family)